MMNKTLELLINLQDLIHMEEEIRSEGYIKILKETLGLTDEEAEKRREEALAALHKEKEAIESNLPGDILRRFNRLMKRYGRAVVPVVGEICLNCSSHIPTSYLTQSGEVITCPNCGIFLYMPLPSTKE